MELQGSLGKLQIGDIVQILDMKGATGVLRLSDGSGGSGQIFFKSGRIVHVVGPDGASSPFVLSDLFEWESSPGAEFLFDSGVVDVPETLSSSNVSLLLDAAVAKDVFAGLKNRFGTIQLIPILSPTPPPSEVQLIPEDWVLLRNLANGRLLIDVLAESRLEPATFQSSLLKLVDAGVLVLEAVESGPPPPDPRETLDGVLAAVDFALRYFCAQLGPMVVENFARQAMATAEERNLSLTSVQIRGGSETCRIEVEDAPALVAALKRDARATLRSFGEFLFDLRRRCAVIVRPLAHSTEDEILGPGSARVRELGLALVSP